YAVEASPLARAERATVAQVSVEPVVDSLRDLEEGPVAFAHEPSRVDPPVTQVAEARTQELRDAAAFGRGVDVPQRVPAQAGGGATQHGPVSINVCRLEQRPE